MAEAKKKKMGPKAAAKYLKKKMEELGSDETVQWYLKQGFEGTTTKFNQLASNIFDPLDLYFCLLDVSKVATGEHIKNYSTQYTELTKYSPAWVGFYPSVYNVKELIDTEGNTEEVPINDLEQIEAMPTMNRGAKFYFAGLKYQITRTECKVDGNPSQGWQAFAQDAKTSKTGIYIRACGNARFIFNFALNTHPTRMNYGSAPTVMNVVGKYFLRNILMNPNDEHDHTFLEDACDEDTEW